MTTLKRVNGVYIATVDGVQYIFETFKEAFAFISKNFKDRCVNSTLFERG